MCSKLMHKFVKKSVLDSADTMYKITNLDVLDKQTHKVATEIDIGFATLAKSKAVNEGVVLEFRIDCTKLIFHVTGKILERSPMKYKLGRSLYCLNPQKMIDLPEACSKAFQMVLKKLIEARWRSMQQQMSYWSRTNASYNL